MRLTTTFNLLRENEACTNGYRKLAKHLGGVEEYGPDTEINLLTILESNGFEDAVWCLGATVQDADKISRLIACDFAESVLHIFEGKFPGDDRPRKAIESARGFVDGTVMMEEMRAARAAAHAAVDSVDVDGADGSSYSAAFSAAHAADAAAYAAYASYGVFSAAHAADAAARSAAYAASYYAAFGTSIWSNTVQLSAILREHLADEEGAL